MTLIEELRSKKSRDNRELLDKAADRIEELERELIKYKAKELCSCHHKCNDTTDCVVEEEAREYLPFVLTNEDKVSVKDKCIDDIAKLICVYPQCVYYNIVGECANKECQFVDKAEALYKAGYQKQSEWISVKDRLPEESGEYLVFGRTFGNKKPQIWICECISIGSIMGWCNNAKNPIVEAWMPLPEAPKMKGGEVE